MRGACEYGLSIFGALGVLVVPSSAPPPKSQLGFGIRTRSCTPPTPPPSTRRRLDIHDQDALGKRTPTPVGTHVCVKGQSTSIVAPPALERSSVLLPWEGGASPKYVVVFAPHGGTLGDGRDCRQADVPVGGGGGMEKQSTAA